MRRVLLIIGVSLAVLVLALIAFVNLRSHNAGRLPPPDPSLPIRMSDGSDVPLAQVLDLARSHMLTTTGESVAAAAPSGAGVDLAMEMRSADSLSDLGVTLDAMLSDPVFALAQRELQAGRLDQALALFQSIGEEQPSYAIARGLIGQHILALQEDQPAKGVPFVQDALLADPFNRASWKDLALVYAGTLGFDRH